METVNAPQAPAAVGPYSHAVRAGDWLICSGQIGLDPRTGQLVEGGFEAQVQQVLANVQAVLNSQGLGWGQVAKSTVFLTRMEDFSVFNRLYAEALGEARPARSTVAVAALPKGAAVELEVLVYAR